ncbi:hypothetical protein STEG23_017111 [Scotinomys teguina]
MRLPIHTFMLYDLREMDTFSQTLLKVRSGLTSVTVNSLTSVAIQLSPLHRFSFGKLLGVEIVIIHLRQVPRPICKHSYYNEDYQK